MDTGKYGEDKAAEYLESLDFHILMRNFHSRWGEIDIIAENCKYIVFAEVKTRAFGSMVTPEEAVTKAKQKKLLKTAQFYFVRHPMTKQPRFDVIAVVLGPGETVMELRHIPNAFGC